MSNGNMSIVKQAIEHFKKGEFEQAKAYYERAAQAYGKQYFTANIRLCDSRLRLFDSSNYLVDLNKYKKLSLNITAQNFYEPVCPSFSEKIKIKENVDEDGYLQIGSEDYSILIESWIDDAEDITLKLKLTDESEVQLENNESIIKISFFDDKRNEVIDPGLTNLSWSKYLKCWYFYLNGSKGLHSIDFIKPKGISSIEITFSKWKSEQLYIANSLDIVRKPSITQLLRKDFSQIINEMKSPVVKSTIEPIENKLCYVLNHSLPYQSEGYATRAHGLAKAMKSEGLNVICLSRPGFPWSFLKEHKGKVLPTFEEIDGITYQRIIEPSGWKGTHNYILKAAHELEIKLKELKPSYVMAASDFKNALPAYLAARRLGIPFIYEIRGFWEITQESKQPEIVNSSGYHLTQYLETELALQADHVFTLTEAMRQLLVSRGIKKEKITLLPNSCDPNVFDPLLNPKNETLSKQLNLAKDIPVIGYIGTFNSYEGLEDLVHACGALYKEGESFRLMLVGADPSNNTPQGIVASNLKALATKYGFDDWLIMPGRIPHSEVGNYYSLIDIAPFTRKALPVTELVSPLKPLEAMAMSKALVVSSVDALAEMIQDKKTGFVFQKENIEDLANKLLALINDKSLRKYLGIQARSWVINERTWEICAKKIKHQVNTLEKYPLRSNLSSKPKLVARTAKEYKVAFIADEFSYNSFKNEFQAVIIEPDNWEQVFEQQKPDIFFCESAWSGVDSNRRPWQGKIYTSVNWKKENRTVLLNILNYCRKNAIPTVFWNKEDPTHFTDRVHDFIATAKEFDFVFTTAEECCDLYKEEYGVKNVHALPFATNPKLFNPIEYKDRKNKVVFAGSWYENHKERSAVMEKILDSLINAGFKIEIYDRYYGGSDLLHKWPEKYDAFIKPSLPHSQMPEVYKSSNIGLNFNTVTDSSTMFARRVFELMSSNTLVVSNYSKGVEKIFGDLVVFADKEPERLLNLNETEIERIRERALNLVLSQHTYTNRWEEILTKIGMPWVKEKENISLVCKVKTEQDVEKAIDHYQNYFAQDGENKILLLVDESVEPLKVAKFYQNYNRVGITVTSMSHIKKYQIKDKYSPIETKFFIYCCAENLPRYEWVEKAKLHMQYVGEICVTPKIGNASRLEEVSGNCILLGRSNIFINSVVEVSDKTILTYSI